MEEEMRKLKEEKKTIENIGIQDEILAISEARGLWEQERESLISENSYLAQVT